MFEILVLIGIVLILKSSFTKNQDGKAKNISEDEKNMANGIVKEIEFMHDGYIGKPGCIFASRHFTPDKVGTSMIQIIGTFKRNELCVNKARSYGYEIEAEEDGYYHVSKIIHGSYRSWKKAYGTYVARSIAHKYANDVVQYKDNMLSIMVDSKEIMELLNNL